MKLRKTIKAASPLGGLLLAIGMILIAVFGLVLWVGTYQVANNETINPYLANQINALSANLSGPNNGVFTNGLASSVVTQANGTKGVIGSLSAATQAAGSAFSFISTITNFLNPFSPSSFMNIFVVGPLAALGIPAQYAALIGYIMVIAMLTLLILSALLIFNLL